MKNDKLEDEVEKKRKEFKGKIAEDIVRGRMKKKRKGERVKVKI